MNAFGSTLMMLTGCGKTFRREWHQSEKKSKGSKLAYLVLRRISSVRSSNVPVVPTAVTQEQTSRLKPTRELFELASIHHYGGFLWNDLAAHSNFVL